MLEFSITSLLYPTIPVVRKQRLTQFKDGSVTVPFLNMLTAKVTVSVYDQVCEDILPLERMLFVRYLGTPVFWGPIVDPEWNLDSGEVTINALGPEYRMVKHYLRRGDDALNGKTTDGGAIDLDKGVVKVDSSGMKLMVAAAQNIPAQTTRGVPDLGILYGRVPSTVDPMSPNGYEDPANPTALGYEVSRGNECFSTLKSIADQQGSPEFQFRPVDFQSADAANGYCKMDIVKQLGTDKSNTLKFHYNFGLNNLAGYISSPGGSAVITHDHVLSSNGKNRGTAAALAPSARFGPYVNWDALNQNADSATLANYGKKQVLDYGEPPEFIALTLKPTVDNDDTYPRYGVDYVVGDIVTAGARRGFYDRSQKVRITDVGLAQVNEGTATTPTMMVVPEGTVSVSIGVED